MSGYAKSGYEKDYCKTPLAHLSEVIGTVCPNCVMKPVQRKAERMTDDKAAREEMTVILEDLYDRLFDMDQALNKVMSWKQRHSPRRLSREDMERAIRKAICRFADPEVSACEAVDAILALQERPSDSHSQKEPEQPNQGAQEARSFGLIPGNIVPLPPQHPQCITCGHCIGCQSCGAKRHAND